MKHKSLPRFKLKIRKIITNKIIIAVLILVLIAVFSNQFYQSRQKVKRSIQYRNGRITDAIGSHPVHTLLADEQRLVTGTFKMPSQTEVISIKSCSSSKDSSNITSLLSLQKQSFAYLLTYDHLSMKEANCKLQDVIDMFGRPNLSVTIVGTLDKPGEQLLFFDHGVNKLPPKVTTDPPVVAPRDTSAKSTATVNPIALNNLGKYSLCESNTVLNIVAHQDDDLLFINPDVRYAPGALSKP